MPYCPKCDMEFVEGVQVCTDCGGKLFASIEEAKAAQEEAEKQAMKEFLSQVKEELALENEELGEEEISEEEFKEKLLAASNAPKRQPVPPSTVYVKKSERYQDMKSSASAFLLVGGAALLLSALIFTGIIPIAGSRRISFGGLLAVMGIACLAVCVKTKKDAAGMKAEADKENEETEALIRWFLEKHTAEEIDQTLAQEQAQDKEMELSPEELSLKRFSLIQDYLATEKDLPDQTYIDALSEEIYGRLWG